MTDQPAPPVLLHRDGRAAHVVLNRPRAINALTHEMVDLIHAALVEWAADDTVETVVLTGAGERGLCAGGDIVTMAADAKGGGSAAAAFWAAEYALNALIADYPKPYVAVMDGIVLGGGIGLSAHAGLRVVTERSSVGMPETGIGFVPDVGGTWLLSRAPGETGTHLGLTGLPIGAGDAIATGFADHFVPSERLPELIAALATEDAEAVVARLEGPTPPSDLMAARDWIDASYAGDDPAAILSRLRTTGIDAAATAADTIEAKSPTSVALTLRALRTVGGFDGLGDALDLEYRLALAVHATAGDFVEGVRAQLVDKDRSPRWSPATLAEVDGAVVAAHFADLGERELGLGRA